MTHYFIDSHCHFDFQAFEKDRELLWEAMLQQDLRQIIVPGVRADAFASQVQLCEQHGWAYALGLHPYFLDDYQEQDFQELERFIQESSPIAMGEIGLDYMLNGPSKELQESVFSRQVVMAKEYSLPLILHARKSHDQLVAILKREQFQYGGIVHAFSGSLQQAKNYLQLGFKLGFGGALTYDRAVRLRSLIKELPDDAWVLETDAPDMLPSFLYEEGEKRNTPLSLIKITELVAKLRKQSVEQIKQQNLDNLLSVFPNLQAAT